MVEQQTYEIVDGVRRAKAAWLCGQTAIIAQDFTGSVFSVLISQLRSPHKEHIDLAGINGFRWQRVLSATHAGLNLPPIEIVLGTRGITVQEAEVMLDELDLFR